MLDSVDTSYYEGSVVSVLNSVDTPYYGCSVVSVLDSVDTPYYEGSVASALGTWLATVSRQIFGPIKFRPLSAKTHFGRIKLSTCTAAACTTVTLNLAKENFRRNKYKFSAKHVQAENSRK